MIKSPVDLSVIILSYRNREKLRVTLDAVYKSVTNFSFEVIVVDNDSRDGSVEMVEKEFPLSRVIPNENKGFSHGNNVGLRASLGSIVLFLNPDTAVATNVLEECIKKIQSDQKIGFLTCRLIKEDGTLDLAARRSFPNPLNSFARLTHLDKIFPKTLGTYNRMGVPENHEQETDAMSGAFMMARREVIDKIGEWDERFFMYGEDIDYCYRAHKMNFRNIYFPAVTTTHFKGQSSKKTPYFSLYHFHNAMWLFYQKHYQQDYPLLLNWLVWSGIWLRFHFLVLVNKFRSNPYVSK